MSLVTWMQEYYQPRENPTRLQALEESVKKWEGLQPTAMQKHQVEWGIGGWGIQDKYEVSLSVNDKTCALCQLYTSNTEEDCIECPLAQIRCGVRCDMLLGDEQQSPYRLRYTQPHVMLNWLKQALTKETTK